MTKSVHAVGLVVVAAACANEHRVTVAVATDQAIGSVSDRFLSVAVDTAMVVGGTFWNPDPNAGSGSTGNYPVPPYDFTRPRLRALAGALAPAYLRIGGTDADKTHVDLSAVPATTPPPGYKWILTSAEWDGVVDFARALDYQIAFTMNAGAGPRVADAWQPDDVRPLVQLVAQRGDPVAVWELGNEIDAYAITLGITTTPQQYAADLAAARALLDGEMPGARLAGPASAYWPVAGEVVPFLGDALAAGGSSLDIVTWHYYPQQSDRCPFASRRAGLNVMLDPDHLDEVRAWAADVATKQARGAPHAEIWLGETGNAQCGGQPGVSDAFVATFWWLDQLGTIAALGQPVAIRQDLSGSNYGLLDDTTLDPNPDYWASLLWRRLMGARVLAASVDASAPTVRAYAHCAADGSGATMLALNLSATETVTVRAPALDGTDSARYVVTAHALDARALALEGMTLAAAADGTLPAFAPTRGSGRAELELPPLSWAFLTVHGAAPNACR
jgi:heparanase 1